MTCTGVGMDIVCPVHIYSPCSVDGNISECVHLEKVKDGGVGGTTEVKGDGEERPILATRWEHTWGWAQEEARELFMSSSSGREALVDCLAWSIG